MARKRTQSSGNGLKVDTICYDIEQIVGEALDEDASDRRKVVNRKVEIDLYLSKSLTEKELSEISQL